MIFFPINFCISTAGKNEKSLYISSALSTDRVNISLRRKRGLIIFENPEGHQKSISVKKLSEDEVDMLLKTLRSYRDEKKRKERQEEEPELDVTISKIKTKGAYKVVEEIWNDFEYFVEFLHYGPAYILDYFGDINFDYGAARFELRRRLLNLGKDMIRKGRKERNPLYVLAGNLLKEEGPGFRGFREMKLSKRFEDYLWSKYHKACAEAPGQLKDVFEGIVLDYLGIPRGFWLKYVGEAYDRFVKAWNSHYAPPKTP